MATCRVCKASYHACSSCGLQDWEYDYCRMECLEQDQKLKKAELLNKFRLSNEEFEELISDARHYYLY